MKNLLIIFILGLSISQADIITGTQLCGLCTADSHSTCTVGIGCQCNTGYKLNGGSTACEADSGIIENSATCTTAAGCGADSHATCIEETGCQCDTGYKLNGGSTACEADTGIIENTATCTLCTDAHSTCNVGTGCECTTGYELNSGNTACVEKTDTPTDIITGTGSCTAADGCSDSHATCTVGTGCKCTTGYELNSGKTACVETTVTPPSDIITGTGSCTAADGCEDSHATCTVGTGCKCNTGYELNSGKTACVETTVTPASDIITGTGSCTTAAGCTDSHATCTVGTGCKCNDGYQLKQDKSGCEAKSGSGSGTGSGNNENDSDDNSSFLKYSLLAVLSLLF